MKIVEEALDFAYKAHKGQYRKGTNVPYIIHPLNVFQNLSRYGFSMNAQIAGLFHDLLEDTNVREEDIHRKFGEEVLRLVISVSEERDFEPTSQDWKTRKEHTIMELKNCQSMDTIAIAIADKMDNASSLLDDLVIYKEKIWDRFRAPYPEQKWYYQNLVEVFQFQENQFPKIVQLSQKFRTIVRSIFLEKN